MVNSIPVQEQIGTPIATKGSPGRTPPANALRRLFSTSSPLARHQTHTDVDLKSFDEVREAENNFYSFLDSELDKVESFYRLKEEQAAKRLAVLREQLHEMRNRRIEEMRANKQMKKDSNQMQDRGSTATEQGISGQRWISNLESRIFPPGPNSKNLMMMHRTQHPIGASVDGGRDYIRRPTSQEVSYRVAKRKLKLALQEFYRGLELLKSYAILNRTAFRKLNKKYDKAVNARPQYRYMNEKVKPSYFVTSDVLDRYIHDVEDLYARYFEGGNKKIAAGKLRSLTQRPMDESASAFRNGLLMGIGAVFGIQGLVQGTQLLFSDDVVLRVRTSFLLQIYAGYFLMLYLFLFFCLDCRIWTLTKINYPFIFEFDQRHHLDWRQLAEFPSICFLLLGFFVWLNFSLLGSPSMFLYFPCILVGVTFILLFLPAPTLWHRSRRWFLYSHVSVSLTLL